MKRASAILVFDYGLDPDTVEAFSLSRLYTWIMAGNDLFKDREKQKGGR